jgi:hypothetical protein
VCMCVFVCVSVYVYVLRIGYIITYLHTDMNHPLGMGKMLRWKSEERSEAIEKIRKIKIICT